MPTAQANGEIVIRCPVCHYFSSRMIGEFLETNCGNTRCHTTITVRKQGNELNVTATPHASGKNKQA